MHVLNPDQAEFTSPCPAPPLVCYQPLDTQRVGVVAGSPLPGGNALQWGPPGSLCTPPSIRSWGPRTQT